MASAFWFESLQARLVHIFVWIHRLRVIDVAYAVGVSYVFLKVAQTIHRRSRTTALRGPPNPSFVWGITRLLFASPGTGAQYEEWAEEYGWVYEVPWVLGGRKVVLCDPKAIAHVFGQEPWTYVSSPFGRLSTEVLVGKGILTATGEIHRRLRRTLSPAFNTTAIRNLTPIFYDVAYEAKGVVDALIESNGGDSTIIEVQSWMNHVSLDAIGTAGFSYDFGALRGKITPMSKILDTFANIAESTGLLLFAVAEAFPWIFLSITPRPRLVRELNDTMGEIANRLLTKSKKEREVGSVGESEEKSILGLLIAAEDQQGRLQLTREEVLPQAKVLLIAGYETISITLTWALIELCKNLDIQSKLRVELLALESDPTYDQLVHQLPYLDAVVHETLRMHPAVPDFTRMATRDDVIPLSKPVHSRSGRRVDHISVAKGTLLFISASSINRSKALWGDDANEFKPERWIEERGIPASAKEVQGHRHLLTFIDGPRTCLGKGFALAEFKIVLSVLVKRFVFELRDGPDTVIESKMSVILPRPKVAGEEGTAVPLRVRRFE